MAFTGSCHCGAIAFTVEADMPETVLSCNCSHCRRKGFLLAFFPASRFRLDRGEDAIRTYRFHTHRLAHQFCGTCGTQPFAEGENPDGSDSRAVNMRCVPEADLDAFTVKHYDGAAH
jgi:hypothetical protein